MTVIAPEGEKFASVRAIEANGRNVSTLARPLSEASSRQAAIGVLLLFCALGIASSPLFDGSIDAETMRDEDCLLVRKNASYAKAYFLGPGFLDVFVDSLRSNTTASYWFPQPKDSAFLGFPFLDQSEYSSGPCAILDTPPTANSPSCIIMTGHEGGVSAYGLCRNGSEFISIHYLLLLVTPTDIGGLLSAGMWIESMREVVMVGLTSTPECVNGNKLTAYPNLSDLREMSGAFSRATTEHVNHWFDMMTLPHPVRQRLFYLVGKQDDRQGLVLPSRKRQSFDKIIAQNAYGSTLADKLEIEAPYASSNFVYVTLYRVAGADITLPRLQFTFAVAAQALALLVFFLSIAIRNTALNTYHLVHQILRLPTFMFIAVQLLYVLYYQIFDIAYIANSTDSEPLNAKKVVYSAGLGIIVLHQLDVRAAVSLWPKMTNNDTYYFVRILWMLVSLGLFLWSLTVRDASHYIVQTSPDCALGASECNVTRMFLFQHYVCLVMLLAHPVSYGIIQAMQWRRNPIEYVPADVRTSSDQETSFEHYACGGPLTDYYYYKTLIATTVEHPYKKHEYATCSKAVRDEGFVLLGGGCGLLVRAKDLYVVTLMRLVSRRLAGWINLSICVAYVHNDRVTAMRRISYQALWIACQRWDGRISYPDIG
jgi:hypothetical protein